jgi:hypothetical protein
MQCGQKKPQGMPVTVAILLTAETAATAGTQTIVKSPVTILYTSIIRYGRNSRDDETAALMPVNLRVL